MSDFSNRVVLVTGASKGIGYVISKQFVERGATVIMNASNSDRLEDSRAKLEGETGRQVFASQGSVVSESDVKAVVGHVIEKFGRIDILVNNAGVYPAKDIKDMSEEEWDNVFDVNVKGSFLMCKETVNHMLKEGIKGRIINISSGNYKSAMMGFGAYCASKAAQVMLTKVLALEVGHLGITVNSVSPGLVDIGAGEDVMPQSYKDAFCKQIPNGRLGLPEDIACAVLFLASDEANYINGDVIHVDGALGAGRYTVRK